VPSVTGNSRDARAGRGVAGRPAMLLPCPATRGHNPPGRFRDGSCPRHSVLCVFVWVFVLHLVAQRRVDAEAGLPEISDLLFQNMRFFGPDCPCVKASELQHGQQAEKRSTRDSRMHRGCFGRGPTNLRTLPEPTALPGQARQKVNGDKKGQHRCESSA
jgi:hypothetical protein